MKVKIKAIVWNSNLTDSEVGRARNIGEEWEVSNERLEVLRQRTDVRVEVIEEVKTEAVKKETTKKAVKRKSE